MILPKDYNIRYVPNQNRWYYRAPDGEWVSSNEGGIQRHLITRELLNPDPTKGCKFSELEIAMEDIKDYYRVDYTGEFAGYLNPGPQSIETEKALVLKGARMLEPVEGDCDFYWSFIEAAFPEPDQADAVHGWNYWTQLALRQDPLGKWRHGQALIMVGDPGKGKSSYQDIITFQMTGRATDPELFMTGGSTFNEEMGRCEHYCLSDPGRNSGKSEQFLSQVKKIVSNVITPVHPKGSKLFSLPLFKRASITFNQDSESINILRGMIKSDQDKVMIVNFKNAGQFAPRAVKIPGGLNFWEWDATMRNQASAYIWRLLNAYQIPAHMQDPDGRYGIFYRNLPIESDIAAATPEQADEAIQDVVYHAVFDGSQNLTGPQGARERIGVKAGKVFDLTREPHIRDRASKYLDLSSEDRVGRLLVRWLRDYQGVCFDFSFIGYQQPNRGTSNFYDFVANPVESDSDIRKRKLRRILDEIRQRARDRGDNQFHFV
jgi:hypothetical protein